MAWESVANRPSHGRAAWIAQFMGGGVAVEASEICGARRVEVTLTGVVVSLADSVAGADPREVRAGFVRVNQREIGETGFVPADLEVHGIWKRTGWLLTTATISY